VSSRHLAAEAAVIQSMYDFAGDIRESTWCGSDGPHAPRCDGWFCTCPCHAAYPAFRVIELRELAERPVGIL
jgi:hypothetical protein